MTTASTNAILLGGTCSLSDAQQGNQRHSQNLTRIETKNKFSKQKKPVTHHDWDSATLHTETTMLANRLSRENQWYNSPKLGCSWLLFFEVWFHTIVRFSGRIGVTIIFHVEYLNHVFNVSHDSTVSKHTSSRQELLFYVASKTYLSVLSSVNQCINRFDYSISML